MKASSTVLWLEDERYFSDKEASGFVGLANQGATCYLNSLIQSLYLTPEIRSALYQVIFLFLQLSI